MARPRSPNREKAYQIFKRNKGNISNKDIAEILGEDPKTVSKWKTLDKWEKKSGYSKKNSKKTKKETTYDNVDSSNEGIGAAVEKEIIEVPGADELSEKQLLFCIYYTKYFNATKAYQKAYGCTQHAARVSGCNLLAKSNIQATIAKLKEGRINQAMLSPEDIFQKYMDIAFADITDYMRLKNVDMMVGVDDKGRPIYTVMPVVEYEDSENVDGNMIQEFKQTRHGISIKLKDSMKALEWLANHMDMATEEQKAKVESLKNKVKVDNERIKLEREKFERNEW